MPFLQPLGDAEQAAPQPKHLSRTPQEGKCSAETFNAVPAKFCFLRPPCDDAYGVLRYVFDNALPFHAKDKQGAPRKRNSQKFGWHYLPSESYCEDGSQQLWGRGECVEWEVQLPEGIYDVTVGISSLRNVGNSPIPRQYEGVVNGRRINLYVDEVPREVRFDKVLAGGSMRFSGNWPVHYVCIDKSSDEPKATTPIPKQRQRPESDVPSFSTCAKGGPGDWNRPDAVLYWSCTKSTKKWVRQPAVRAVEAEDVYDMLKKFLQSRPGPDGSATLLDRLGPPLRDSQQWWCLPWRKRWEERGGTSWMRAWHGTKMEALYSILYHGKLFESRGEEHGERILEGLPGVYVHKDTTQKKAENYVRFVPLCGDGIFWAAKWEVRVNRSEAETKNGQWIQPEHSVDLFALWLCGRTPDEMQHNTPFALRWHPELEACPKLLEGRR